MHACVRARCCMACKRRPLTLTRSVSDVAQCHGRYLAAPVLEKGATTRTLYLPANTGGWTHYYSKKAFAGGQNVTVPAPFDELPLFVRQSG
jgi:hypothetical protein